MGAEDVSLALLGRFAAHVAGAAVDEQAWRLRKARTLVKLLALEPGRRLHREQAMDLLWPELDASAAQNNLHQALHAARRVLGADSLTLADAMLGLDAAVVCDVDAFERAAAETRRTTDTSAYRHALDLYGGELLPEDRYEPWVDARRAALRELHGTLCLELAALESPEEAVLTLQRAIAADPLHERAHRALMESYEQLGRRQDALAQYHRLHAALQQALEAAPDEETRLLYRRLLAAAPADTASPLPVQLTTFVGRERELHDVGELLAGGRLVTLTGPGGCGKTRLAIATAERARDGYADGVCFVELGGISDPELVAEATATAVGIRVPSRRTAAEAVAAHLAARNTLLVLDTCEHVVDASASLAEAILLACAGVTVLATSREPLRCSAETTWRVPGLGLTESAELFAARAKSARPSFELTDENAADVDAVCTRLDGLPLAIELAAARVAAFSPAQIAARLGDSLDMLSSGNRTALTRQQTLRAAITWSHDLLTGEERVLLRRLAVFAGSCSLDAVEDVCVGGAIERHGIADLLARLVDKSIVTVDDADAGRYRLLDTIRQFGAERLDEAGERDAVEARMLDWALRFAAAHDPDTATGARERSLARLELDHDNVRAALDAGLRHDAQGALRLASTFWRFWLDRNYFTEGVRRLRAALDAAPEATELRMRTLLAAAALELRSGEPTSFVARAREAEELARRSSRAPFAADVIHRAGLLYVAGLDMASFETACEAALELVARGNAPVRASILHAWSIVPYYVGDYAEARRRLAAALETLAEVPADEPPFFEGATYGFVVLPEGPQGALRPILEETIMLFHRFARAQAEAYALCNLAALERSDGRRDAARTALEDALDRFRALADDAGEALALTGLGNWARSFGEPEAAIAWLEQARELRRRRGDRRAVGMTETDLALALAHSGELERARTLFAHVRDRFRAADDAPGHGGALVTWALAEERAGNFQRAAELARGGAEVWERGLRGHLPGWGWLNAADIYAACGELERAHASVVRAQRLFRRAGDRRGVALCAAHGAAKPALRSGKDRPA